jgi:YD repeat-containing protein
VKHSSCFMSSRRVRAICISLCYVVVLSPLINLSPPTEAHSLATTSGAQKSWGNQPPGFIGSARDFLALLLVMIQGAPAAPAVPGSGLPDLDAARQAQPSEPVAVSPIASTEACTDCTPCSTCGPGSLNHEPVVSAAGPYNGTAGLAINFNGLRSFDVDPGDGISNYAWSFGDGNTGSGATPNHTYQTSGTYTVTLTVTDRHSTTSSASTTAAVAAAVAAPSPSPGGQGNAASFVSQLVPTSMTAGQRYPVSVTMRNTGSTTWSAAHLYRLGSQNPQDNGNWGTNRIYLPANAAPGAEVTFNFTVIAPCNGCEENTTAQFQWRMVQDGVEWFGGQTQNQQVTIISNYHPPNGGAPTFGPFEDLFNSRLAPQHRTGQPGDDLLSRNIHWETSLVDLAGRAGMNLDLKLSYNSKATWTKTENWEGAVAYTFDADRGSPAPGFRLGFPSIQGPFTNYQAQAGAYMLITPSGGHVELRQISDSSVYESVDSSYLQLLDGGNGSLLLRSPDGTQLSYWSINSEYRCTEIKDRNGNFITIKYDPINGAANLGRVTSVIDTLGRTINFNYDTNFRLQSITQVRAGQTHLWATFGYGNLNVQTNFSYPCPPDEQSSSGVCAQAPTQGLPANNRISVLTQVGFDDGSRATFDYTSWGQIYRIRQRAADGHTLRETTYDLPLDNRVTQEDCPRFTERQDSAESWNNNEPVTTTVLSDGDEHGPFDEATYAAGTSSQASYREYSTSDHGDWLRGLVTRTEVRDAAYDLKKWTTTVWARDQGGVPYALNPRPKRTAITDAEGNRSQTSFEYTSFGLLSDIVEQAPVGTTDWAILRRTHTDYDLSPAYVNRHIFGLVQGQYLFAPDTLNSPSVQTLMSKTTYEYDVDSGICTGICASSAAEANNPAVTQHDGVNYGAGFLVGRGALTRVRRWDASDELNSSKRLTSSIHYDVLGSVIRTADPLDHRISISYTDAFSVDGANIQNPALLTLAYPTTVTDPDNFSSSARHNYDLGKVTRQQDPKGAAQTSQYDVAGRVTRVSNAVNGAYLATTYPLDQTVIVNSASIKDLNPANRVYSFTVFDGAGRLRATASDFPGGSLPYRGEFTVFDPLGRAIRASNPTEMNASWNADGGDDAGWHFTSQSYDWKGRPLVTTNTDGTTRNASYGGCGCAGGEIVTLSDEGSLVDGSLKKRQQKLYADALGRTWKIETFNFDGSVYSTNANTFNARDQITRVLVQQGTNGPGHETLMTFDGYGRLTARKTPIQSGPTLFAYDLDGALRSETDARGAIKTLTYNSRHLVENLTYSAPQGVAAPGPTSFSYDEMGHRLWMADDSGRVDYQYNTQSQLLSETRHFNGLAAAYPLSYSYNLAGEVESLTDPTGNVVNYDYDKSGQLTNVSGSAFAGVSQYVSGMHYRASSALKSLTYGNGLGLQQGYDTRLRLTSFAVGSLLSAEFQYHADGQIRFAKDNSDPRMDRAYYYDQVGRLSAALSGAEARGENSADGIFRQTYQYDIWDNLTARGENRFWSGGEPFAVTYVNDRDQGATYDADGRVTHDSNNRTHAYDATGQQTTTHELSRASSWAAGGPGGTMPPGGYYTTTTLTITQTYDGDGATTKRLETKTQSTPFYQPVTTQRVDYFLRSSVFGGEVITELTSTGGKKKTNVYAGGAIVAEQQLFNEGQQSITWKHQNPITGTVAESGTAGAPGLKREFDPYGLELGNSDPYLENAEPDYASMGGSSYREGGNPFGDVNGCQWNGMPVACDFLFSFVLRTQKVAEIHIGRNLNQGFTSSARWVDQTDKTKVKSRVTPADGRGNATGPPGAWSTPAPVEASGHWEIWGSALGNGLPSDNGEYKRGLSTKEWDSLDPVFRTVREALENPDCAKWITDDIKRWQPNPTNDLDRLIEVKHFFYGGAPGSLATTYTNGGGFLENIWIGLRRSFFQDSFWGRVNTILHELRHASSYGMILHPEDFKGKDSNARMTAFLEGGGVIETQKGFDVGVNTNCIEPLKRAAAKH